MFLGFMKNISGNVAIMFAICLSMLVMSVGAAIDISRLHDYKTSIQDIADAAVLAAAISGETDQITLQLIAEASVNANNTTTSALTTQLVILADNSIRVDVSLTADLILMGMFGDSTKNIMGSAEAPPKGSSPLNLALVLDSTQSMEGSKMTVLRTAANNLVDFLENDDGKVQISVIPFARYTRIPRSYDSESWLEITEPVNTCWMTHDSDNSVNCDPVTYDDDENPVYNCEVKVEKEVCAIVEYEGCVASRHRPEHLLAGFTGQRIQGYAAGGNCSTEIRPLTTNFNDIKATINAIEPSGKTYMPSGLIWGWRSLTKSTPMVEANTHDFNERKSAMVLMSDGENTQSLADEPNEYGFNGLYHWDTDIDDANDTTSTLCSNIKNDGISVYTVAFEVTDSATLDILRNCASSPAQFYSANNAAQLSNAFQSIGEKLAQVRLSK